MDYNFNYLNFTINKFYNINHKLIINISYHIELNILNLLSQNILAYRYDVQILAIYIDI